MRNTGIVLPVLWPKLRKPERWQCGQTYAELYAEGKKPAVVGLRNALLQVAGFDFVPENLRSNTFAAAATEVLKAHEAMNNFYNEPPLMRTLAALGTSIPGPAFPICMTATLSVFLGNFYGYSYAAQESATHILKALSKERWEYYLGECLPGDRRILYKLTQRSPCVRWMELVGDLDLGPDLVNDPNIKTLLSSSRDRNEQRVRKAAEQIAENLLGP